MALPEQNLGFGLVPADAMCAYGAGYIWMPGLTLLDLFDASRSPAVQAAGKDQFACAFWFEMHAKLAPPVCTCMASPAASDLRLLTNCFRAADLQPSRLKVAKAAGQVDVWRAKLAGKELPILFRHVSACRSLPENPRAARDDACDVDSLSYSPVIHSV